MVLISFRKGSFVRTLYIKVKERFRVRFGSSKKIMEDHKGGIELKNNKNKEGARVILSFPII